MYLDVSHDTEFIRQNGTKRRPYKTVLVFWSRQPQPSNQNSLNLRVMIYYDRAIKETESLKCFI